MACENIPEENSETMEEVCLIKSDSDFLIVSDVEIDSDLIPKNNFFLKSVLIFCCSKNFRKKSPT